MNFTILAITFGLIFVAELPDKTMIATIVMSSRYRPLPVWIGAGAGHGRQRRRWPSWPDGSSSSSPTVWVEAVVAALFAAGVALPDLREGVRREHEGRGGGGRAALGPPGGPGGLHRHRRGRARRPHPDPHRQPGGPLPQPLVGLRRIGHRPRHRDGGRRDRRPGPAAVSCPWPPSAGWRASSWPASLSSALVQAARG